jgi:2,4-dienoyl-CoA reductase-like NADH-dependent reductase (Old Yellow Enzyme family)
LQPTEIAGRKVPNRLAVHPMEGCDAEDDGGPGKLTLRRYRRFAAGGSGLIWFEATAVVPEGRSNARQLCLSPRNVASFKELARRTRAAAHESLGEENNPLLILQLTHSGRYCNPDGTLRPVIAHHNEVLDPMQGLPIDYPLVTDEELDQLQDAYLEAAGLAVEAGYDGVDVKACHGYLVSELLASHTRSNSKYGGSFENRSRFLLEVINRISDKFPELIVTSRISAYDGLPYPFGFGAHRQTGEEDLREASALLQRLNGLGCPLINVSVGNPYHNPHLGRPFNTPIADAETPDEHPLVGVARLVRITGRLQQTIRNLPLVGTGYSWLRHFFPHVGATVLEAGRAGMIGVGRLAFAYPDFAKDLATRRRLDPEQVCIACSGCSQIMRDGGCTGCIVRDQTIYSEEYREGRRRAEQKEASP